jgi:hypothetical protein
VRKFHPSDTRRGCSDMRHLQKCSMKWILGVLLGVGLLAFFGGALAERNGYLDGLLAAWASKATDAPAVQSVHYQAVLAAGDASIPNFDNAVTAFSGRLQRLGTKSHLLTSDPKQVTEWRGWATANRIDVMFNQMELRPGDGCLVFVTSHGNEYGLSMKVDGEEYKFLTPRRLAGILTRHCNDVPTVAILSGCHSGTFLTPQMEAENRIILTAARYDRTSFGCSADYVYTYFDECLLAAMDVPGTWRAIFARTSTCVAEKERWKNFTPSLPQAYFGEAVRDLGID